MNLSTKQKQTHRHKEQSCGCRVAGVWGMDWEFGVSRYKLLHIEWINCKVPLCSTRNYIQYPVINHNGKGKSQPTKQKPNWAWQKPVRSKMYFPLTLLVARMVKNLPECRRPKFDLWVGKIPWRRECLPTPIFLLGNPMHRGVWWATVHGITKNLIWLNNHHFDPSQNLKSLPSFLSQSIRLGRGLLVRGAKWLNSENFYFSSLDWPWRHPGLWSCYLRMLGKDLADGQPSPQVD